VSKEKNPAMCTLDNSSALFNFSVPTRVLVCHVAGAAGEVQGEKPCGREGGQRVPHHHAQVLLQLIGCGGDAGRYGCSAFDLCFLVCECICSCVCAHMCVCVPVCFWLYLCDCSLAMCVTCPSFPLTTDSLGHASPKVKEETLLNDA